MIKDPIIAVLPAGYRLEGRKSVTLEEIVNSGMAVVVEIHQGKRTVMEYLLSPVLKVRAEAFQN